MNNLKAPITTQSGSAAMPYDFGAVEITLGGPLQPGLIYETTIIDYLNFLCSSGYDSTKIKGISRTAPSNFPCPQNSSFMHGSYLFLYYMGEELSKKQAAQEAQIRKLRA